MRYSSPPSGDKMNIHMEYELQESSELLHVFTRCQLLANQLREVLKEFQAFNSITSKINIYKPTGLKSLLTFSTFNAKGKLPVRKIESHH